MRKVGFLILTVCLLSVGGCSSTKSNGSEMGGADGTGSGLSENDINARREGRFGDSGIPTAEGEGMFRDIRFDFASADISDSARQDLEYNAQVLKDRSDLHVQLEGHTDSRGTNEYNLALGARRSRSVYDVLVSYGIESSRLSTISYGEDVPLEQGENEAAWARNRRVHFSPFGSR